MPAQATPSGSSLENLATILGRVRADVHSQAGRIGANAAFLGKLGHTYLADGLVDDRTYLYEDIIRLATSLPNDSELREDLSAQFIKTLWNNLEHPPISYLGDKFKYRTADGSYNNIMYPQLGAAGSPYARSVTPRHQPGRARPDPALIYDSLLKRDGPARPHPCKVSSALFYFATIIIHDIFRTRNGDSSVAACSSYLDLAPLYGSNEAEQKLVRTGRDGLLKPDAFSEMRILAQPPGVAALLITFNRFHNWVVGELATINENGRFNPVPERHADHDKEFNYRDNDLFQTARLITCGLYVNIILNDYLRTILNLNDNPQNSDWRLDPRDHFANVFDSEGTPSGIGNQVSAEFNFVYRWHSSTSDRDEAWLNDFMKHEVLGEGAPDPDALTPAQFLAKVGQWFATKVPQDPGQRTFGGLLRAHDGKFNDADLVALLRTATDTTAGAFGARNTPTALKAIEILGIEQGRRWGLATLNEFRHFFKLKPFAKFSEVNSDPSVAEALEALYGHPDNIELYPGLMSEEAKQVFSPGSGLCPGFTVSEAILSDAVTLVRGDRFYAHEYGPQSLTSFGYTAASSDFAVAGGGVMYKLLMRAFPGWYRASSVYALYPFNTPDKTKEMLANRKDKLVRELDYTPPAPVPPPVPVVSWKGVVALLHDQQRFKVPWGPHTYQLTGHDYMLSGDKPANAAQREFVKERLYRPEDTLEQVRAFYESLTEDLIRKNARKLGQQYQIDVVDLGNTIHAAFTGEFFGIPLRSDGAPSAASAKTYTPRELYGVLARLFEYVFLDLDTAKSYKHLATATRETKELGAVMRAVVQSVRASEDGGLVSMIRNFLVGGNEYYNHLTAAGTGTGKRLSGFGKDLIRTLMEQGKAGDVEEVVWTIIPTAAAACATQAQGWAQLLDVYLSDEYSHHWPAIVELAHSKDPKSFELLKKYALEGFRIFPAASGVLRVTASPAPVTVPGAPHPLQPGSVVFADFITAGRDPARFPDPEQIKLDRPEDAYIHHGWGAHSCLGRPIVTVAGAAMLRAFARNARNVVRAPGEQGEMKRKLEGGAFPVFLAADGSEWESFPVSKKVLFDGFGETVHGTLGGEHFGRVTSSS